LNAIDDLNDFLPYPIPKSETYETLSGYIASLSPELPQIGDDIQDENYSFKILTMNRKSPEVIELTVKKLNT
jgi:CBS domain containing-hemolysin-like protein